MAPSADINECTELSGGLPLHSCFSVNNVQCVNEVGSYKCDCTSSTHVPLNSDKTKCDREYWPRVP